MESKEGWEDERAVEMGKERAEAFLEVRREGEEMAQERVQRGEERGVETGEATAGEERAEALAVEVHRFLRMPCPAAPWSSVRAPRTVARSTAEPT